MDYAVDNMGIAYEPYLQYESRYLLNIYSLNHTLLYALLRSGITHWIHMDIYLIHIIHKHYDDD